MKKQLRIEYKDGGKTKLTKSNCQNNEIFITYLKQIPVGSILKAILYTYPLKDNEPLVLIKDGVPRNDKVYELVHH